MRLSKRMSLIAILMVLALDAAACGGDGGDTVLDTDSGDAGGAATGGQFSVAIGEPQILQSGNTQESCGSQVLPGLFSPPVIIHPVTAHPSNIVYESIDSYHLK